MELDVTQQAIVNATDKKILCVAGSGSGKTAVLTERVRRIINTEPQANIVAITFTNAAANEMQTRLGNVPSTCFIGTIHSYANKLLTAKGINTSSIIKNENFKDLFTLIKLHPQVVTQVNHLLVDEFQDISDTQFEFFEQLNADNYFYVGDDYQAIYTFGDDPGNVNNFIKLSDDMDWTVYYLKNNYRSGRNILSFATKFMSKVTRKINKNVKPCAPYEGNVQERFDFSQENIINIIDGYGDYGNWFVLCRSNAQVNSTMWALKKANIDSITFRKAELSKGQLESYIKSDQVKVLTIHSAKGLEIDNVIVEPFSITREGDTGRRLAYVAATRAKERLIWFGNKPKKKRYSEYEIW